MCTCLLRAILSNAVLVAVLVGEVSLGEYARGEEREAIVDRTEDTGGGGHRDCSQRSGEDADESDNEIDSEGDAEDGGENYHARKTRAMPS